MCMKLTKYISMRKHPIATGMSYPSTQGHLASQACSTLFCRFLFPQCVT